MKVRINQAGSVANFIIIGVVLVVLTAGVIYAVRQTDAPAPRETPVATQPEKTAEAPKQDDKPQDSKPTPDEAESTPAPTPAPEESPAVAAPTVAAIPQTGPVDTAFQLVAIGAIVVAIVGFVRSRTLRSSL